MSHTLPTKPYTIPVDQVLIGILKEIMPYASVRAQRNSDGWKFDELPIIFFRKMGGSSVSNEPSGEQTACSWTYRFDCIHTSADTANLLADDLYRSLDTLIEPSVPGYNPVIFNNCWITNVEEDELPDLQSVSISPDGTRLFAVTQVAFTLTFRRHV